MSNDRTTSYRRFRHVLLVSGAVLMGIGIAFAAPPIADEINKLAFDGDDLIDSAVSVGLAALVLLFSVRLVNRRTRLGRRGWIGVAIAAAVVMYAISFGPACRMCEDGYLDGRAAWIVYRPMTWLTVRGPYPIRRSIWRWVDLFRANPRYSPCYPISHEFDVQYPDVNWL